MTMTISETRSQITGKIHSIETGGTVDGPGIRYVIFTQGCPLRCLYCHNPDCRHLEDGKQVTVDELIEDIVKYRSYMEFSGGGVTISGGEPLMQPEFVREIGRRCQELGIHFVLDTSGYVNLTTAKPVLDCVDLVLLDIKSFDPETYLKVTSVSLQPTLDFASYLHKIHKPTWIRFVLVPELTNAPDNIEGLAKFVAALSNVVRVEIIPFHKMGEYKWEQLGYEYSLKNTPVPTQAEIETTKKIFQDFGLVVTS